LTPIQDASETELFHEENRERNFDNKTLVKLNYSTQENRERNFDNKMLVKLNYSTEENRERNLTTRS
jgi:hypothetical protein